MPAPGPDLHQRKRRRTINSCAECYRRKQRCDNQKPCANCKSRAVEDRCIYNQDGNDEAYETFASAVASIGGQPQQQPSPPQEVRPRYWRQPDAHLCDMALVVPNAGYRKVPRPASKDLVQAPTLESKWSSAVALLPPPRVTDQLVHVYFESCNWYHSLLERCYFDPPYHTWMSFLPSSVPRLDELTTELKYFLPMLLGMFAVAVQYLTADSPLLEHLNLESEQQAIKLSQSYSDTSESVLDALGRISAGDCIFPVHTDILRVWWLKGLARGSDAWHIMSRAIRHAQEIRMHLKNEIKPLPNHSIEQTLARVWEEESRRRLWANLVFWDAQVGLTLNRPRTIVLDDCDLDPPMDCPFPTDPSKTLILNGRPVGKEFDLPTPFTANLFCYNLGLLIHELRSLSAKIRRSPSHSPWEFDPTDLHDRACRLYDRVPATLKIGAAADLSYDARYAFLPMQRETILTNLHGFLTNLHRLFIAVRPASRFTVLDSALTVLESQQRVFEHASPSHHRFYGLVFMTIHATLLMFGVLESHAETIRGYEAQVAQATDLAIKRLEKVSAVNPIARPGLQLLIPCRERSKHLFAHAWTPGESSSLAGPETAALGTPNSLGAPSTQPLGGADVAAAPAQPSTLTPSTGMPRTPSLYPDGTTSSTLLDADGGFHFDMGNEFDIQYWTEQMDDMMDMQLLFPELYAGTGEVSLGGGS